MSGPNVVERRLENRGGHYVQVDVVDTGTTVLGVFAVYLGLFAVSLVVCCGPLLLVWHDWTTAISLGSLPAIFLTFVGLYRYEQRSLRPYRLGRKLEAAGYRERAGSRNPRSRDGSGRVPDVNPLLVAAASLHDQESRRGRLGGDLHPLAAVDAPAALPTWAPPAHPTVHLEDPEKPGAAWCGGPVLGVYGGPDLRVDCVVCIDLRRSRRGR